MSYGIIAPTLLETAAAGNAPGREVRGRECRWRKESEREGSSQIHIFGYATDW